jgi:hypothetical protein
LFILPVSRRPTPKPNGSNCFFLHESRAIKSRYVALKFSEMQDFKTNFGDEASDPRYEERLRLMSEAVGRARLTLGEEEGKLSGFDLYNYSEKHALSTVRT